uniref:Endothelial cell adhesion molecule b n=1 Tax=Amphilophus citrinellus TaxID=61819 RepID=A0A3Q0RFL7_AMPCI
MKVMIRSDAFRMNCVVVAVVVVSGDTKKVEFPRKEMEVVQGQMVVLQAWYSPSTDISKNSVIWYFSGNESKQVGMPKQCNVVVTFWFPPSPPVCTMTGNPVVKGNVTLSCKSSHGKPVPQYKWTKAAPMSEVFFSPMQNERHGTLRLSNLTKSMSGKYICRASNTAGADSCSINLEVFASSNAGVIAAATLGSVVGLVAMVLFLIFILRRRGETEEEIANEIKEDAQAPKRVSWAKSNTGSDVMSKNGTLSSIATKANTLQGLPGYNIGGTPSRKHRRPPSANGAPSQVLRSPKRTEGAQPQTAPPLTVSPTVSSSTLTRMGAVAVMVPAQSQAGSLV